MESLDIGQNQSIVDILPQLISAIGDINSVDLIVLNAMSQSDRVVDDPEVKPIVAEALHIRKEYKVPFWEAILLLARRENGAALDLVLDAAIHHQPMSDAADKIRVAAGELSAERLREIAGEAGESRIITLSSKVALNDSETPGHLQMLDFRIRPSEDNERLAAGIMKRVGAEGILLNSGNSYHFYGYTLMGSEAELSAFLGRVSLFAPFIDQRWVAHQMIEGACALRISKGKSFADPPIFVRHVGADLTQPSKLPKIVSKLNSLRCCRCHTSSVILLYSTLIRLPMTTMATTTPPASCRAEAAL